MHISAKYMILAGMLLVSACGDPETAAQNTIAKVHDTLQKEKDNLDPLQRLDSYNQMIKEVEAVAGNTDTATGRAIAAGQAVDGITLAGLKQKRDALAPRAKCYADPTVDCLTPFGTNATRDTSGSPANAFADAERLVCDRGFSAADQSLDNIKINKPAYSRELVQVALAAAGCHKPDEVKAAIETYMSAIPAQGSERVSALLSVLATDDLKDGWPVVADELENELKSGAISGQDAANATLTLAINYANRGDVKAALDKYAYFTDKLGYKADTDSVDKLVVAAMLAGDVDTGLKMKIASETDKRYGIDESRKATYSIIETKVAACTLAARLMGLSPFYDKYGICPDRILESLGSSDKSFDDNFVPPDAKEKAQDEKAADAIESGLDTLASALKKPNSDTAWFDDAYGAMAIARQKLGEPGKANAAIKKISDLRVREYGQVDYNSGSRGHFPAFTAARFLVALAQKDLDAAAHYMTIGNLYSDSAGKLLCTTVGRTQNAEQALAIANTISKQRDLWHCYHDLIPEMAAAGKSDEVEKLIDAWSGDPRVKDGFHLQVIDGMIASGDVDGARSYAKKHDVVKDDRGKLGLDQRLMDSDKVAKDRSKAEPIIREMFQIGQADDEKSNASGTYNSRFARGSSYEAQAAAERAFSNGYTDLGIELYEKASYKDQRPLLQAITDKISKADMTRVLMLAQDNVSGNNLGYVIDRAIRHLKKAGG